MNSPIWPLAALFCWMAGMTALIYGRKFWAWVFILGGLGLIVAWALVSR